MPCVASGAIAGVDILSVYIRISDVIVVVIDGDVVVASPAAVTAPAPATPSRANGQAYAEGDGHAGRVVSRRRIGDGWVGVCRRSVHYRGVLARNVNYLRIRLLYDNHALAVDNLCLHLHLVVRLQIASPFCFGTHALHSVHDIGFLRQKCVA